MNIVELQKAFELMSDQELSQQQEHGFLRDTEVKRRVALRNSYQAQQQQADASKTVSEKNIEELMAGGIPSADPMMGQGGDPSMQAGIAGGMEGPQGPPMMYGGGMLGFDGGGPVRGYAAGSLLFDEGGEGDEEVVEEGTAALTAEEMLYEAVPGIYEAAASEIAREDAIGGAEYQDWVRTQKFGDKTDLKAFYKHQDKEKQKKIRRASASAAGMGVVPQWYQEEGERERIDTRIRGIHEAIVENQDNPKYVTYLSKALDTDKSINELPSLAEFQATPGYALQAGFTSTSLDGEEGEGETDGTGGEEEEASLERSLEDIMDTGQSGLDDILATLGTGRIDNYLQRVQDPERLKATHQAEKDTAQGMLDRAGGIRDLQDARADQQKSMLADSLGISEARIEELMGEMDTEGEIESRRKADALKNLSFMFMDSPANLAENIRGTTSGIESLDATLKQERKDATKAIFAEREKRQTKKEVGLSGIFTTEEGALKDTDVAQKAFDTVGAQILREQADGTIEGEKEALSAYIDLAKVRAQQMGVWNSTMASANAAMQSAISTRDNSLADVKNWEALQNKFADLMNNAGSEEEYKYYADIKKQVDAAAAMVEQKNALAILGDDPRKAIAGKLVTEEEFRDRSKDGSFMSRYDKDGNKRSAGI